MLYIIIQRPEGAINTNYILKFKAGKISLPSFASGYYMADIDDGSGLLLSDAGLVLTVYKNVYVLRQAVATSYLASNKAVFIINANFNYDDLQIIQNNFNRVEFRNENGVLITDNGLPWNDGTYPPDAKNRAELTGLHASHAVINPELETALMGDETNKERVQE